MSNAGASRHDPDTRIERFAHGGAPAWIAEVLAERRDEILGRWLEANARQPFHEARPERAVADDVPRLFDALVGLLRRHAETGDGGAPLDQPEIREAARHHARARFEQGLQAAQIVTEFRLLRQEIGRALRLYLAPGTPAEEVAGAELLVHDALDSAGAVSLTAYDVHEEERRRLAAQVVALGAEKDYAHGLLDSLVASAPVGIAFWDLEFRYLRLNAAMAELNGLPVEAHLGKTIAEVLPGLWPQLEGPLRRVLETREPVRALDVAGETPRQPGVVRHRQSGYYAVRLPGGACVGLGGVVVDTTERVRAEARQRFLAEAGRELARSLDEEATLAAVARLVVPAVAEQCSVYLTGEGSEGGELRRVAAVHADPEKERLMAELVRFPVAADADHPVRRAIATRRTVIAPPPGPGAVDRFATGNEHARILRALAAGGATIVPLVARGRALGAISAGWSPGATGEAVDRVLMEELAATAALAIDNTRLYREAQAAIRARDEFLGTVAHDLRTPLTSVHGYAQLLTRTVAGAAFAGEVRERIGRGLAEIEGAVGRMRAMIDELLEMARAEAGGAPPLDLRPTDLVALARRVAAQAGGDQREGGGHVIRVEAEVPELVGEWDALRLERAVGNLVENAVKYSPAGGEVTVRVARSRAAGGEGDADRRGGWAVLSVSDRGIGIPAADVGRVFDRFHRAANVPEGSRGAGIGLASVKQMVEQHGGSIAVESEEGRGSTFAIRLPIKGQA